MSASATITTSRVLARRMVVPSNAVATAVDIALRLAGHGTPVFPCHPGIDPSDPDDPKAKKPLTQHGHKDATTDEVQIRRWWARHPNALVGVPTGSASGLLVIDIDPGGTDFLLEHEELDTARRHKTRRGSHYLFRQPAGTSIPCSVAQLAEGVDVRADGGYIIWWPATGRNAFGPEVDQLPTPSNSLLNLLVGKRKASPANDELSIPEPRLGLSFGELATLLPPIDPDVSRDDWLHVLMAVHHEAGGSEAGLELVNEWSSKGRKYKGVEDVRARWRSFKVDRDSVVGAAWLKKFSKERAALRPGPNDSGPRFTVIPDYQFVERNPLTWHIKGVLPKAELVVVYGQSGSGKSFFVFDMCAAIARGSPWQERKTAKGRVVYVVAEGAAGFLNRLKAFAKTHDGNFPGVSIVADGPNLLGEQDHASLAQQIEVTGGADLIVIDTLASCSPGADENTAKDMGRVIEHCKQLHKATGATVLLVHHSGKDEGKGARGWSGLRAAADAEIEVSKNGDQRVATVTKMKDGEDGAKFAFKLVPVEVGVDSDKEPVTSCNVEPVAVTPAGQRKEPQPGTKERALLDAIRDTPSIDGRVTTESVIETVVRQRPKPDGRDTRKQHVTRDLQALVSKGLISVEGGTCWAL
jgi:AAA domain/Bifunctional DNA primase/polymerase, N-terminal/Primase C terminal 2 (PriCT-2)